MSVTSSKRHGPLRRGALVLLLIAVASVLLAACGDDDDGGGSVDKATQLPWGEFTLNDTTAGRVESGEELDIVLVSINTSAPYWGPVRDGVAQAGEDLDVKAGFTGPPDYSIEQEVAQIDELVTRGVDGMAVAVGDAATLTPAIDRVVDAGIPVFTVDVDAPDSHRFAFVGQGNRESGTVAGEEFVKAFYERYEKGAGPYKVILTATDVAGEYARERFAGFKEVVDATGDFEYTDPTTTGPDPAKVFSTVQDLFRANRDAKGLYMVDETIVQGGTYIERNDLSDTVVVAGHNFAPGTEELLKSGAIDASVATQLHKEGYDVIKYVAEFLRTGELPPCEPVCEVGVEVANQKNVDQIDFPAG
jgi:ABC-type sugar transport system substrate-binding protein